MKHAALLALLLAVLTPLQSSALENEELLGLVAMPLAVAAVSDVTGVPAGDLSHFVTTLNRAAVPPTQFVQVVRYAPVALVVQDQQPTFVEYVDQQYYDGITGTRLVSVIEDRYRNYDVEPQFVALREPATTYVVRDDYIPPVVVTRVAQYQPVYQARPAYYVGDSNDLLSLIAMPLAVAAVSSLAGVPMNDLSSLVMSLNAARMPPVQFVEVMRYAPAALVLDYGEPRFVRYVDTQVVSGLRGPALIEVIDRRLRTYDLEPRFDFVREPRILADDDYYDRDRYFPPIVRTRVAEVSSHPHGGPPGQLKKELGLQTGAEVVHGTRPGFDSRDVRTTRVERERGRPATGRMRVTERRDDDRRVVRERREPTKKARQAERRTARRDAVKKAGRPRAERTRLDRSRNERPRAERTRTVKAERPQRQKADRAERGQGGRSQGAAANRGGGQGKGKGKGKG
jgi:hypothetical protein